MNAQNCPSFLMMAPMEGIIDYTLRDIFTRIGGLDRCVTEFVRVSGLVLPRRVFTKYCPELLSNCQTPSGTPVYLQLLGDKPEIMAANASKAAELGARAIDINYGCPAKTVNNHGGGSVLLQSPEALYSISLSMRKALPNDIPLTAKIRLGFKDKSLALENVLALQAAGITEIAIHARTKTEGYRPPAYWEEIGKITQHCSVPIIANGEIWNLQDLQRCIQESNTDRIMLGRGLVACPDLALLAKGESETSLHWGDICLLLIHYHDKLTQSCEERFINNLIKQWLVYLKVQYAEAHLFFEKVKRIRESSVMRESIYQEFTFQQKRKSISGKIGHLDLRQTINSLEQAPMNAAQV